jgi:hypothetical protein
MLPGQSMFEPNWFQLAQFDPAGLHTLAQSSYKLAGSKTFRTNLNQVDSTDF